jgi:hypothetical protein
MVRFTLALPILFACGTARSPSVQGSVAERTRARCAYEVRVPADSPWIVDVSARCDGDAITGFRAPSAELGAFVRLRDGAGTLTNGAFVAEKPRRARAELAYSVDLDAMARSFEAIDVARRFGGSLLAPASSFLLAPDPDPDGAPVELEFSSGAPFATGLRRGASGYAIETHELRVATYTAFGVRERRSFSAGGTRLHVARLDGALDTHFDAVAAWIEKAASAVIDFYGRSLDSEITVFVAPLPEERGIPFGKLLPESGPGIVVLLGEHTTEPELYRDWVLVHELFHVGSPSFQDEGKWFDEGLATYYEPIIRARAGFLPEHAVWKEFLTAMPRGLPAMTERGLESAQSYGDTYWGGALFCLLADVEVRRLSAGKLGLEAGVRAVLANGGIASEVWTLARSLSVADGALGAPALAKLAERHARRGSPVDLPGLFRDLGVSLAPDGSVRFDDTAPLAFVRRSLISGGSSPPLAP